MVHSEPQIAQDAAIADDRSTMSTIGLLVSNLLPLLGVLFLSWTAFSVIALYWVENLVIGAINVLKMITCRGDADPAQLAKLVNQKDLTEAERQQVAESVEDMKQLGTHAIKLFLVPFFIVHYGIFCFVHGVFVFVLLGPDEGFGGPSPAKFLQAIRDEQLLWAIAGLAAAHLLSFFTDYLGRGEYRQTHVMLLMFQPYGRIVLLHVALLFGGFVITMAGSPMLLLIAFVLGKTFAEWKLQGFSLGRFAR